MATKQDRAFNVRGSAAYMFEAFQGDSVVEMRSPDSVIRKFSGLYATPTCARKQHLQSATDARQHAC